MYFILVDELTFNETNSAIIETLTYILYYAGKNLQRWKNN